MTSRYETLFSFSIFAKIFANSITNHNCDRRENQILIASRKFPRNSHALAKTGNKRSFRPTKILNLSGKRVETNTHRSLLADRAYVRSVTNNGSVWVNSRLMEIRLHNDGENVRINIVLISSATPNS